MTARFVAAMAASLIMAGAICACSTGTPAAAPAAAPAAPVSNSGEGIYQGNCTACHLTRGTGVNNLYPRLAGSSVVLGDPAELARWIIKGQRPAAMPAGRYTTAMPLFGWLNPTDAAALLTYLRASFGNHAPPVDAATVEKALR
jgi:mono/diheme cytochrome c family protein